MDSLGAPDYEADSLLSQYLFFHYGKPEEQFPFSFGGADGLGFPQRCAELALTYSDAQKRTSALDLGCGVGASALALSSHFQRVVGLDYSHAFVNAANALLRIGSRMVCVADEANVPRSYQVALPKNAQPDRVGFVQGDAQQLPAEIGSFDLVLACNLLCRLSEPMRLLQRLPDLVNRDGVLFITTPLTWLEHLTPQGQRIGNDQQTALEAMREHFADHFELLTQTDMPFLIREHRRKYQYGIAHASVWRRC
jgi:putative 4-mercaptohistidine N1-methyltranferase